MDFSPLTVGALILAPIRYFFKTYGGANNLLWDEDPNKRQVELDYFNNLHKIPIQTRPRVLVDRGEYAIQKISVSDNLMAGKSLKETAGLQDNTNMVFYSGNAQITIEARQQGVCELVTDMVSHFIVWTRPLLCSTQGFKELGLPMRISPCQLLPGSEDDEKFQVIISLPYLREEQYQVKNDGILLKAVNVELQNALTGVTIQV